MTLTITRSPGGASISPFMVLGYEYTRPSGNIIHEIIGTSDPYVTYGPLKTKEGKLTFLCRTAADAAALEAFHDAPAVFALVDTQQTVGNITYVISEGGSVSVTQTDDREYWIVTIDAKGNYS